MVYSFIQASSEHSICFAVPDSEVKAVEDVLKSQFSQALVAGRLSKVCYWVSTIYKYLNS